ncbi:hypothetical protein GOODEAATRI_000211 [Goodea atripinnis]|uniref:Uncharacterized protein n=1 Tax=Goodea atripinnis TaxID=208336 RepID=A0ABV0PUJ9_9TELE
MNVEPGELSALDIAKQSIPSPFGIDSPNTRLPPSLCLGARSSAPRQSLSLSWSAEYSQFLGLYGDVGEMATSKPSLGEKKMPCSSHTVLSDTFSPCMFLLINETPVKRFKTKRFILSIAPSRMLCGNLKMIYVNVISLCVIQHSQLMSKLSQPYHKLKRLDITARLMCFSGTCLIAGRLRWGWSKKPHLYM